MKMARFPLLLLGLTLLSGCATKCYVDEHFDELSDRLTSLEDKMRAQEAKMPPLESRVNAADARLPALDSKITALEARMAAQDARITAVDNKPVPRQELSPADQAAIREARDMAKSALDKANSAETAARDATRRSEKMFDLHQKK